MYLNNHVFTFPIIILESYLISLCNVMGISLGWNIQLHVSNCHFSKFFTKIPLVTSK